jgi:hypothetical protein
VEYAAEMHKDALKAHGGWSLELADRVHWNSREAWVSSEDPSGGTPGRANSVSINLPDEEPPAMLRAGWYDESLMFILFSGTVCQTGDCKAIFEPGGLVLTPAPAPVYGFPGFFFRVPPDLPYTIIYKVELQGTITSCYGEPALLQPVGFAVPHHPDSFSVVINEIMFDPATGDPEWIELLNRSKYTVDLKDLIIARADTSGIIHTFSFPHQNFLLPPSSFLLFPDSLALLSSETRPTFPSLTNEPSRLLLLDPSQHIIDQAAYSPDWHDPYLTDSKGISLERIDPSAPGLLRSNWYSCNESQKSTPCKSNSNYSPNPHPPSLTIHYSLLTIHCLSSEPMIIHYEFPSPGWYHELKIFDRSGALIRTAVPFSLAGSSGVLMWDGLDDRKQRVPEGIYVLIIRYRHPGGQWGRWKGVCGLTLD